MNDYKVSLTDQSGVSLHDAMTITARELPEVLIFGDLAFKLAQMGDPNVYVLVRNAVVIA